MPYFTLGAINKIVSRNATFASESNSGPYFPWIVPDLGQTPVNGVYPAAEVTIGVLNYWLLFFSSDHANPGDTQSGVHLMVCLTSADPKLEASWVTIDTIAAASTANPIIDATDAPGANIQPETPCCYKSGSTFYMWLHEDNTGGIQRTSLWTSANGYAFTRQGDCLPTSAGSGEMANFHNGYFAMAPNELFTGLTHRYIGWSLASWTCTVGTEDGDFYNNQLVGANDLSSLAWDFIRLEGFGQSPSTYDGVSATHRPLRIENCPNGFRKDNDGRIVGLACVVEAVSGSGNRNSSTAEMVFDRNYRYASQPRTILAYGTGDYTTEVGQPRLVRMGGVEYLLFQAASGATPSVNTIQLAAITFDATADPPDAWPVRNSITTTDFRLLNALPSTMGNFSTSSVTFDGTTGITLSSASAANALLRLGPVFTPSYYDCIEIMFYGLTAALTGDVMNFGFMTGTETQDQFSDATDNVQCFTAVNGGAKVYNKVGGLNDNFSTPSTTAGHANGNQVNAGGGMRKQIGLRWHPHRGAAGELVLIGEDGAPLYRATLVDVPTLSTARMPAIAFNSTSGVKSISFQQVSIRFLSVDGYRSEITLNNAPGLGAKLVRVA